MRPDGVMMRLDVVMLRSDGATVRSDGVLTRSGGVMIRSDGMMMRSDGVMMRSGAIGRCDDAVRRRDGGQEESIPLTSFYFGSGIGAFPYSLRPSCVPASAFSDPHILHAALCFACSIRCFSSINL